VGETRQYTTKHSTKLSSFLARSVLEVKLSYSAVKKGLCSVLESGGSVLIVPQACIAGKLKGKSVQYHDLSGKEEGQVLYYKFVETCKELCKGRETQVFGGTYGNRQVLTMDTEGPFTHVFDF
jgi:D-Tyr-tRNAtyr deacylase